MTFSSAIALFGALVVLAALPSVSVLVVSTRSASLGFIHGVFTTLGIWVGDLIFIVIAIWGLSFLVETLRSFFAIVKLLGGAYLIFLGIGLCRSKIKEIETEKIEKSSLFSSFLTGLLLTLGDQKATLFYLGFFPAFLDLSQISYRDTALVIAIATVAVVGVKLGYAFIAARTCLRLSSRFKKRLNLAAGGIAIAVGICLLVQVRY